MGFYEFFCGGGMARLGLGPRWPCLFANDIDESKAASYRANFGPSEELAVKDVGKVKTSELPGHANLAWASFPCQDLSLAGNGQGLKGERSGTFWAFWGLMKGLATEGRAPRMIVLENVRGAITSHQGRDLAAICEALTEGGYTYSPMLIDANHFLPQSRPRLFIVAFSRNISPPQSIIATGPILPWHPKSFSQAYARLTSVSRASWIWIAPPVPYGGAEKLSDIIEEVPQSVDWHTPTETKRLLDLMSPVNRGKVEKAMGLRGRLIGTVYKRTRPDESGVKRQRAEVRFDEVAGCLRTPGGGSSRQIILVVEGRKVRSRLLSPREAARLMGLPDNYLLPERYNEAYHLVGDGVAVPVVSWLARTILEPSIEKLTTEAAA